MADYPKTQATVTGLIGCGLIIAGFILVLAALILLFALFLYIF
jgi:hypothetical protein